VATSEPPDPIYEEETDSPGAGYVWVGGYWGWTGTDWGWNWGQWAPAPPGGEIYIEPYYERVGGTVVYVHGYWGPHDYVRRSYGGQQIRFAATVRPANYHRGEHIVVERRVGPAPGHRPGGMYVKATGTLRPLPHQTVPTHVSASMHASVGPRGGEAEAHGAASGAGNGAGHGAGQPQQNGKKKPDAAPAAHPAGGGSGPPKSGGAPHGGGVAPHNSGGSKKH